MNKSFNEFIYLLKPTGYGMNHQHNVQQLYVLSILDDLWSILYLRVLYLSENKQRLVSLTA